MAGNLTAMIASIFSGSAVTPDPYYEYTTLLLPGNGTNGAQNNTFLDGSTNNFTITRNGNTTQGTFSPFSQTGWGNYFDGNLDYLTVPDNAAFTLGNSDFCIELWINSSPSMAGYAGFFGQWANATTNCSYVFRTQTSQIVQFSYTTTGNGQTGTVVNGSALTTNSWNHLVVCRSGANLAIFQNGTRTATHNISTLTISDSTRDMQIGYSTDGGHVLGYMSNLRLVKGSSVYDPTQTTITVPTAPLTAITNTSLLTCQSNRFIDNSTNNFTITRNGDTRVVAFSPFNPTASWSAATYGGSGYFDGSGDYLSIAYNAALDIGSSDFSIETWVYITNLAGSSFQAVYAKRNGLPGYTFGIKSTGVLFTWNGSTEVNTSGITLAEKTWYHLVWSSVSGTLRMFVNGTSYYSASYSISTNTYAPTIGAGAGAAGGAIGDYLFGYVSGFKLVKGTGVTSVTVPTQPPTATGSNLLLNFTNAGIYDATSKNDLETVGNAQISTTQSKWGGSSISFDGTGDWLLIPDQPPQRIGTGKFTIELWVYRNSSGTYGLVGKGTGTTGWLVSLNSSNQVVFTYGSSTITSTGTVSATTWTHIAVVREGTSTNQTKIYINGTNDGTGTVSTDFNQTNSMYIGADRTGGSAANAYVQDVRITNDARYTANFTAPTAAFPTL
jgi:hypothetical protein